MTYGLTENGFIIPTFEEIYNMNLADFKTVKPDLRVTDSNLVISVLKHQAAKEYNSSLQALIEYNNRSVYTAVGKALEDDVRDRGFIRLDPTSSFGQIEIIGAPGTSIPAFWGIETDDNKQFITLNNMSVEIDETGILTLDVRSEKTGRDYNTEANTITIMSVVVQGIESITNHSATTGGRNQETDTELRSRYISSLFFVSSFSAPGIARYLLENTEANKCTVFENENDIEDSEGRPPHSFEAMVTGDTDENILDALQEYKLVGIRAYGDITREVDDIVLGFSRPAVIDLYMKIDLTVDSAWKPEYEAPIKAALIDYVAGIDVGGTIYLHVLIGEVYRNSQGIITLDILQGDDPNNLVATDYKPPKGAVARVLEENITINVKGG